jgi:four helix bundle protein
MFWKRRRNLAFQTVETLDVYRLAETFCDRVWQIVPTWPPLAKDTIGKQLIRAADSIGANIAEGDGRGSSADNRRCLRIARGSLVEVRFWMRRAYVRNLLTETDVKEMKPLIDELAPKLNAYIRSITRRMTTTSKTPNTK